MLNLEKSEPTSFGYANIMDATQDFEAEYYRPKTKETKQTFEIFLSFLQAELGDIQQVTKILNFIRMCLKVLLIWC